MVNIEQFCTNFLKYLHIVIDRYASKKPMIQFFKPIIYRAADNSVGYISQFARLIADKEGNIDIAVILDELQQNLVSTANFTANLPVVGEIYVGEGCIKIGIPYTNENLVFTKNDLIEMKEILTNKN